MMKFFLISLLVTVPCLGADWLEDLAQLVHEKEGLNITKAAAIINKYVKQDEKEVAQLEKKMQEKKEEGFWGTLRGGTYQVQWAAAASTLRYHKKVAQVIKELPENKKDRRKFINHLKALKQNYIDLKELKDQYAAAKEFTEKIKIGAFIAAKELQIKSRKALVKSMFLL